MRDIIKKVPIPTAGLALGLAALGNLLVYWSWPLQAVCGTLSLCLVLLLGCKVVLFPGMIRDDLKNSIMASVSGTLFMTLMQLATYLASHAYEAAYLVWVLAVIGHVGLIVWFTSTYIRGFKLHEVFPTYFICYVGIIVASVTSATFGQRLVGTILFWFGFVCYIVLFALVTYRYAKHEVPEGARPLFCIYAAPMSLSLVGYLSVTDAPSAVFVAVLLVLAQLLYFFVLFHLPKFISPTFYPSYAAMTFPFVISATALLRGMGLLADVFSLADSAQWLLTGADVLVTLETVFATCMVFYVFIHYTRFFFQRVEKPQDPQVIAEEAADEKFEEFFEN